MPTNPITNLVFVKLLLHLSMSSTPLASEKQREYTGLTLSKDHHFYIPLTKYSDNY